MRQQSGDGMRIPGLQSQVMPTGPDEQSSQEAREMVNCVLRLARF